MQRLNLRLDFELQLPTEQSVKEQSEQGIGRRRPWDWENPSGGNFQASDMRHFEPSHQGISGEDVVLSTWSGRQLSVWEERIDSSDQTGSLRPAPAESLDRSHHIVRDHFIWGRKRIRDLKLWKNGRSWSKDKKRDSWRTQVWSGVSCYLMYPVQGFYLDHRQKWRGCFPWSTARMGGFCCICWFCYKHFLLVLNGMLEFRLNDSFSLTFDRTVECRCGCRPSLGRAGGSKSREDSSSLTKDCPYLDFPGLDSHMVVQDYNC